MFKFLLKILGLNPIPTPVYSEEVLRAAEESKCDPSEIIWCEFCSDYHQKLY